MEQNSMFNVKPAWETNDPMVFVEMQQMAQLLTGPGAQVVAQQSLQQSSGNQNGDQ